MAPSLASELMVVPVGGTTAEDPAPVVVTEGLSRPPVAVGTVPVTLFGSSLGFDVMLCPAAIATDDDPVIDVVAGNFPSPSVDKLG